MAQGTIVSVNVGQPRTLPGGPKRPTSIDKRPVPGPVAVHRLGLAGDSISNLKHHGGVDQAVYAFAREDYDRWAERLGRPLRDGLFGENLTTTGLDLNECVVGERWTVGSTVLEVRTIRTPCNTFTRWMAHEGFDDTGWSRRFTQEGRSGVYLAVVEEGHVAAGDTVAVSGVPPGGLRTGTMFRDWATRRSRSTRG